MNRRNKVRLVSFSLAVLVALGSVAILNGAKAKRLEREQTAAVQRAISELDEYISSIQTTLSKGIYATSAPMVSNLSTELWRQATGAKTCLSQLPTGDIDMSSTYRFLSQLGELVMSLNRKVADDKAITEKERNELISLLEYASSLSLNISSLRDGIFDGTVSVFKKSGNVLGGNKELSKDLSVVMSDAEQSMTDSPSLIYDGPFSDHLDSRTPLFLENKAEITQEDALKKCAQICQLPAESFSFSGEEAGMIATYIFSSDTKTVAISKQGGVLSYIISNEYAGESKIKAEEAKTKAVEFLNRNGFENMDSTYFFTSDGICTFNFAFTENDIVYYPDLIKVSVSLENGAVLSVDARNYILSHTKRTLSAPSPEQTERSVISPLLEIISSRLTVIPTDTGKEVFCREFHCVDKNDKEVLVYINNETNDEADILLLLYSDGGVLTK